MSKLGFIKYPKIKRIGDPEVLSIFDQPKDIIYITTKMDGRNVSFWKKDGKLHIASRNQILFKDVRIVGDKSFVDVINFIRRNIPLDKLQPNHIYYAEDLTQPLHILYDNAPPLIGFDIRRKMNVKKSIFLPFVESKKLFDEIGIPTVDIKWKDEARKIKKVKLKDLIGKSKYGGVENEGIVIKNYNRRNEYGRVLFTKIVRDDFQEINKTVFAANKSESNKETSKIVKKYFTRGRIKKIVEKLHNHNMEYGMKMMKKLPSWILRDVMEEEGFEIITSYKMINAKIMRKLVSKKCAKILKDILYNIQMEGNNE